MKLPKRNTLLLPFSWLYGIITGIRNFLYNRGIITSVRFNFPVICVGNIAVGGTGKTPFTAYLIELLNQNFNIALLSRGYKRKTKGFVLANSNSTAEEIGDEPKEILSKFSNIVLAVDGNRVRGVKNLLEVYPHLNIILMDDGFQHRKINPGLKIILTDQHKLFTRDFILPYGMLRESKSAYKRADIIVVTKCDEGITELDMENIIQELKPKTHQQVYFSTIQYQSIYNLNNNSITLDMNNLKAMEVIFMTGIASPESAMKYLTSTGANVRLFQFPDHHYFSEKDYKLLVEQTKAIKGEKIIVITAKDAARIIGDSRIPDALKEIIYVLPQSIKILQNKEDKLISRVLDYVRKN